MLLEVTDLAYPTDDQRFQKEIHQLTQSEVEAWLQDIPNEPAPGATEEYEHFMQRQSYYTKYLNTMIMARDEYRAQSDKLAIEAPPVGNDIREVVDWVQRTGETPIEYLVKTYRSSSAKTLDRISAARAVLDFVHRKMPTTVETKDTRETKEREAQSIELLKRVEALLSGKIQESKQLQRVK
jgi:hypothetical protein